jgi:hypothetical protein
MLEGKKQLLLRIVGFFCDTVLDFNKTSRTRQKIKSGCYGKSENKHNKICHPIILRDMER